MTYRGKIQGGVVVLQEGARLPEGTEVHVVTSERGEETRVKRRDTVWKKLLGVGKWAESQPCKLPGDLARNHDHYLHGLPKRKRT